MTPVKRITAVHDPRLELHVGQERALLYAAGADPTMDRPAHVRAASGVDWLGGRLAVIQDDANFVALVDPRTWRVDAVALPDLDGARQFDVERGNKARKLDLESCFGVQIDGEDVLVALGSGSTAQREGVAFVTERGGEVERHSVLYGALRASREFSGSELNVEGAVRIGDRVRLFQRGNGAPRSGVQPVNASAEIPLEALLDGTGRVPRDGRAFGLEHVTGYDLGALGGIPLTFTDVTSMPDGRLLFLATAEASPDTYDDGVVAGTVLGVIEGSTARYGLIREPTGAPLARKAEGVVLPRGEAGRVYVAFDPDDHRRPATLAEATLVGPWF